MCTTMATALISGDEEVSENDGKDDSDNAKSRHSYANKLKSNVNYSQRLQRNVLEITLERVDKNVEIVIDDKEIERVLFILSMMKDLSRARKTEKESTK